MFLVLKIYCFRSQSLCFILILTFSSMVPVSHFYHPFFGLWNNRFRVQQSTTAAVVVVEPAYRGNYIQ